MYRFLSSCVGWPRRYIDELTKMIDDATQITRQTFMRHVGYGQMKDIEHQLGYQWHPAHGLTMAGDWHVSYHKSKVCGQTVYYFRHSAIEYVYCAEDFKWRTCDADSHKNSRGAS